MDSSFPDTSYTESELAADKILGTWNATDSDGTVTSFVITNAATLSSEFGGLNFSDYFETVTDTGSKKISVKLKDVLTTTQLQTLKDSLTTTETGEITLTVKAIDDKGAETSQNIIVQIIGETPGNANNPTIFTIENQTGFVKEITEASLATSGVLGVIKISDADSINDIINDTDADVTLVSNKSGFAATLSASDYNIVPLIQNGNEWSYRVELTAAGITKVTGANGLALNENLELKIKPKVTDSKNNPATEQELTFRIIGDNNGNSTPDNPTKFFIKQGGVWSDTTFNQTISETALPTNMINGQTYTLGEIKVEDVDSLDNITSNLTLTYSSGLSLSLTNNTHYKLEPDNSSFPTTSKTYKILLTKMGVDALIAQNAFNNGQSVEFKLSVTATDINNGTTITSPTKDYTFKITGDGIPNYAPIADSHEFNQISEDDVFNFDSLDGLGKAYDPDAGDTITYSLFSGSIDVVADSGSTVPAAKLTIIKNALSAPGALIITPNDGIINISTNAKNIIGQQLNDNENIAIKFKYIATDNHGLASDPADITIRIEGENENVAPTAANVSKTFWEDETMDIQLLGNDTDGHIDQYILDINSITVKKENGSNASADVITAVKNMIQDQLSDIQNSGQFTLDNNYFESKLGHNQSYEILFNYRVKDDDGATSTAQPSAKAEILIKGKSAHQINPDELWMSEHDQAGWNVLQNDVIDPNLQHSYTAFFNMNSPITLTIDRNNGQLITKTLTASVWNNFIGAGNDGISVNADALTNYVKNTYNIDIGINSEGYADQVRFNMGYDVKDDITQELLGSSSISVFIDGTEY